jgi:hypothetical protein
VPVIGATRTWIGRSTPGYWPGVPAWASDGVVVVLWWHDTGNGMDPAGITESAGSMPRRLAAA